MMTENEYIELHSKPVNDALNWLEKETHLRTNHARMLSGGAVGRLLNFIAKKIDARNILELGVFTGYSSICLASALPQDGHLDALELNDELESIIRTGYEKAGVAEKINLLFGDAKEIIPTLDRTYDMVFIDANKREYSDYYRLVIDKVRTGGVIVADNVLWDGKILDSLKNHDAQSEGISQFNELVRNDPDVDNFILPIRDGLNIITKLR